MDSKTQTLLLENRALFILGDSSPFRKVLEKIIKSKTFSRVMIVLIAASSVFMAIENPLELPSSHLNQTLFYCDMAVTILFLVEMFIKVLLYGLLFNGDSSYLRQYWNILDFIIVMSSLVSLCIYNEEESARMKVFILIRVFRPLRLIGRNKGLKLALQTMLMAIPQILNVLMVSLIFYLIFGIFCVSFLKGEYYYCYYD